MKSPVRSAKQIGKTICLGYCILMTLGFVQIQLGWYTPYGGEQLMGPLVTKWFLLFFAVMALWVRQIIHSSITERGDALRVHPFTVVGLLYLQIGLMGLDIAHAFSGLIVDHFGIPGGLGLILLASRFVRAEKSPPS